MTTKPKTTLRAPPRKGATAALAATMKGRRGTTYERSDGTPMRRIGVELELAQDEALRILCVRRRTSVSAIIRVLVTEFLQQEGGSHELPGD